MVNLSPELSTLIKVTSRLKKASIPYMLTGSMAVNLYGHARATRDIDLVIEIHPIDVEKVYALFEKDFYISQEALEQAVGQKGMFNIIDNESVFKVDMILLKNDLFSLKKFERKKFITLAGQEISVIAPEDLILSKLEWSRSSLSELQQNDVRAILQISKDSLDYNYLQENAALLGVEKQLNQIYETIGYKP